MPSSVAKLRLANSIKEESDAPGALDGAGFIGGFKRGEAAALVSPMHVPKDVPKDIAAPGKTFYSARRVEVAATSEPRRV